MTAMIQCEGDEDLAGWRESLPALATRSDAPAEVLAPVEDWRGSQGQGGASARQVDDAALQQRLRASEDLLVCAIPHLRWLDALLGEAEHAVYVTDADGIVLYALGTPGLMAPEEGLRPGCDRAEASVGPNGAGTALATGRPVVMQGAAGHRRLWGRGTCAAATVRTPDGRLAGAIDLTTGKGDWRPAHVVAVAHVAYALEREMAGRQARAELEAQFRAARERVAKMELASARERRHADTARATAEALMAVAYSDLKAPLASLVFQLQVVRRAALEGAQELTPEWVASRLGRSSETVLGVVGHMSDVVDAWRASLGRLTLHESTVDVVKVISAVVSRARETASGAPAGLRLQVPSGATLTTDSARFEQVMDNLLACVLRHDHRHPAELTVQETPQGLQVALRDHGSPLPEHELRLLLEGQLSSAPTHAQEAIGLRLWIARRITEALGGTLSVEALPGGGTVYSLSLPRPPAARSPSAR